MHANELYVLPSQWEHNMEHGTPAFRHPQTRKHPFLQAHEMLSSTDCGAGNNVVRMGSRGLPRHPHCRGDNTQSFHIAIWWYTRNEWWPAASSVGGSLSKFTGFILFATFFLKNIKRNSFSDISRVHLYNGNISALPIAVTSCWVKFSCWKRTAKPWAFSSFLSNEKIVLLPLLKKADVESQPEKRMNTVKMKWRLSYLVPYNLCYFYSDLRRRAWREYNFQYLDTMNE